MRLLTQAVYTTDDTVEPMNEFQTFVGEQSLHHFIPTNTVVVKDNPNIKIWSLAVGCTRIILIILKSQKGTTNTNSHERIEYYII